MLPISATRKPERIPIATFGLIAVNILVFFWELTLSNAELRNAYLTLAYNTCNTNGGGLDTFADLMRSMFMHGGWMHIIGNMVFLFVFGPNLEAYLGRVPFVIFYFVTGMAASLVHSFLSTGLCGPVIGASGAIYGIMGGFLLVYPAMRIRSVIFFYRVPMRLMHIQAFYVVLSFFVLDLLDGIASLGPFTTDTGGVAIWAHIGGFLAGILITFFALILKPAPPVDQLAYLDE